MKKIKPTKHIKLTLQPVIWFAIKKWTRVLNGMVQNKGKGVRIRENEVIAAILTVAAVDSYSQLEELLGRQVSEQLESGGVLRLVRSEATGTTDLDAATAFTRGSPEAEGLVPGGTGRGSGVALPRHERAPGEVRRRNGKAGRGSAGSEQGAAA